MTTGSILFDAWVFILLVGVLAYWVLIAPGRMRRRQQQRASERRAAKQEWDPNIYSGRRNR